MPRFVPLRYSKRLAAPRSAQASASPRPTWARRPSPGLRKSKSALLASSKQTAEFNLM